MLHLVHTVTISIKPRPVKLEQAVSESFTSQQAIFEFGRGFYGNTYISVSSGLTLTPGPLQIFCNWKSWVGLEMKLTYVQQPVANMSG